MADDARESRMNRLRVGDKVSYRDESEWPPLEWEGEIKEFANDECTYVVVELSRTDEKDKTHSDTKTLTEDEVKRVA